MLKFINYSFNLFSLEYPLYYLVDPSKPLLTFFLFYVFSNKDALISVTLG